MRTTLGAFLAFGLAGFVGFCVDAGVLALVAPALGLYAGRAVSFLSALATTFILNRSFAFKGSARVISLPRQMTAYALAHAVGGACNLAVYGILVAMVPFLAAHPWLAVGAGSLAGWTINFSLSRRFVF